MNRAGLRLGLVIAAVLPLASCAAGGALPGVAPDHPDQLPIAWFADYWGPFDPALNGRTEEGRPMPMALVDGEQVDRRVDADGEMPPGLADLDPEDIERIAVIKCHRGAWRFGAAAEFGMIMIFTKSYQGPTPIEDASDPSRCH